MSKDCLSLHFQATDGLVAFDYKISECPTNNQIIFGDLEEIL